MDDLERWREGSKKKKKRGMREDENNVRDFGVPLWPVILVRRESVYYLCGPK